MLRFTRRNGREAVEMVLSACVVVACAVCLGWWGCRFELGAPPPPLPEVALRDVIERHVVITWDDNQPRGGGTPIFVELRYEAREAPWSERCAKLRSSDVRADINGHRLEFFGGIPLLPCVHTAWFGDGDQAWGDEADLVLTIADDTDHIEMTIPDGLVERRWHFPADENDGLRPGERVLLIHRPATDRVLRVNSLRIHHYRVDGGFIDLPYELAATDALSVDIPTHVPVHARGIWIDAEFERPAVLRCQNAQSCTSAVDTRAENHVNAVITE